LTIDLVDCLKAIAKLFELKSQSYSSGISV